jgi:hypothetical protein
MRRRIDLRALERAAQELAERGGDAPSGDELARLAERWFVYVPAPAPPPARPAPSR